MLLLWEHGAGFYRLWVPGLGELTTPVTEGTKDEEIEPISWEVEREKAFKAIKDALTSAPALGLPDYSKPFDLYAQGQGLAHALVKVPAVIGCPSLLFVQIPLQGLSTLDGIHRSSQFSVIINNLIDNCIDQFMSTVSQVDNAIDCWHCQKKKKSLLDTEYWCLAKPVHETFRYQPKSSHLFRDTLNYQPQPVKACSCCCPTESLDSLPSVQ